MTATADRPTDLVITNEQTYWSTKQVSALRQLGVDERTEPADLAIFFHHARRTGLDPFARQIYMISRNAKVRGEWTVKNTIQTGIDGYRLIARKSAAKIGVDFDYGPTEWCNADGAWTDVWIGPGAPVAARVTIYRTPEDKQFPAIAHYSEYVQTDRDGNPNSMWQKMAASQLAKCAEALALRRAFPLDLSGIYTDDEMGQAMEDLGETPPAKDAATAPTVPVARKARAPRAKAPEPTTPPPAAHAPEPEQEPEQEPEADPSAPDPDDPQQPTENENSPNLEDLGEKDAAPEAAPEQQESSVVEAPESKPFKACTPGQFRKVTDLLTEAYPGDSPAQKIYLVNWFRSFRKEPDLAALPAKEDVSREEAEALASELAAIVAGELPGT